MARNISLVLSNVTGERNFHLRKFPSAVRLLHMKVQSSSAKSAGPFLRRAMMTVIALALVVQVSPASATSDEQAACVPGNGLHLRVQQGRVQSSADALTWSDRALPVKTFVRAITFGNGQFVAVGGSYLDTPGVILSSRDGVNWTRRNARTRANLYGVSHGNGQFVAVGDRGVILTSSNGVAWKPRSSGRTDTLLASVAFGHGRFVAGGESGLVLTSTNGTDWQSSRLDRSVYVGQIAFAEDRFLVNGGGEAFSSVDALTWHRSMQASVAAVKGF